MINAAIFVAVFCSCVAWLAPRVFRWADTRETHSRIKRLLQLEQALQIARPTKMTWSIPTRIDWPSLCDSLARSTRSGVPARSAFHDTVQLHSDESESLLNHIQVVNSLPDLFDELLSQFDSQNDHDKNDNHYAVSLLQISCVRGNFIPQALDNTSRILRDIRQCNQEANVAASQAILSARILTVFPIIAVSVGCIASSTVRSGIVHPAVVIFLLTGFAINKLGWIFIRAQMTRTLKSSEQHEIMHIVDYLCVSMFAGSSVRTSLTEMPVQSNLARSISQATTNGEPLSNALEPLSQHHSDFARNLAQLILTADSDGLPVIQSVNQLAAEARLERRQQLETRIRQLPTKLSLPLVLCILPSFLLCTLAPFITVVVSGITVPHTVL